MYELRKKTPRISRKKSKGNGKNLRLVDRDFEILRFILEMKSCYSDQIWERFYKSNEIGIKYCQNRLSRLRRSEYLESHYTHDGPVRHYTATNKAREIVIGFFGLDEDEIPEARGSVDLRQFAHDKGLAWMRVFLENMGLVEPWQWDSESSFKHREMFGQDLKKFKLGVVPDAIINIPGKDGGTLSGAIEFEYTLKSKIKRREKVLNLFSKTSYSDEYKYPFKIFIFGNKAIERAYQETFKELFLERGKNFDFSLSSYQFNSRWKDEVNYFKNQSLRCIKYSEFVELYKSGKKLELRKLFKISEVYSNSLELLRSGYEQRENDCVTEQNRRHDEEERAKAERVIWRENQRKEENSKKLFGGLFS